MGALVLGGGATAVVMSTRGQGGAEGTGGTQGPLTVTAEPSKPPEITSAVPSQLAPLPAPVPMPTPVPTPTPSGAASATPRPPKGGPSGAQPATKPAGSTRADQRGLAGENPFQ
jgi:hypothetical protein